ncbi:GDSL-type esterase/lipase family protein [Fibrobacter sp. UWEL]|uniref:GDSL-type esterase/lipase family protein n=1 Tax=Fibrobacter sp. UWEL TaxID=1896209 RepID=UPI0009141D0E|nr:GDSL-type esterase/lipase family protein [Fibrobacter sp. UWEL]SHK49155.1 Lysophospholipase L1 [Fibrobacter sp. UWEL]
MKTFLKYFVAAALFTSVAVSDTTSFTIHVIGDSTVCDYKDNAYPQTGWGQVLAPFFDQSRVKVINYAIGGRSSKSFINDGRLDAVLKATQPGDYIFVQMGTNDRDYSKADRYVPIDSSAYWFQKYVDGAKSKGAHIVLMSPLMLNTYPRNVFDNELTDAAHKNKEYPVKDKIKDVAAKNGVPFIDLTTKTYNLYTQLSSAYISRYVYKMFLAGEYPNYPNGVTNDGTTHFQESGSVVHAQLITAGLQENLNSSTVNASEKAALTTLVGAIAPTYKLTVKANISGSGLITHNQNLPGGAALNLHVSPGSFGKKFQYWADDDCKKVTADSNYYKVKMPYRDITYTAIFEGGANCVTTNHGDENTPVPGSSASQGAVSSSSSSELVMFDILDGTKDWPSLSDLSYPNEVDVGWTEANHVGFTGKGFYNFDNKVGSYATYKMTSYQSASNARMFIRYCNGKTTTSKMTVQVDAKTYDVEFPPSASWDSWDTVYVDDVWLDACDFDLKFTALTSDGGPNIDVVGFDIKDVYRIGAEPKEPVVNSSSSVEGPDGIGRKPVVRDVQMNGRTKQVNLLGRTVNQKASRGVYFERNVK